MMLEFWWNGFLLSLATVGVLKTMQCPYNGFLIFAISWIVWSLALLLILVFPRRLWDLWKRGKK